MPAGRRRNLDRPARWVANHEHPVTLAFGDEQGTHKIALGYDQALVDTIASRCTEVESGARNVDNILRNTMLPEISRQLLTRIAEGEALKPMHIGIGAEGGFVYS